MRDGACNNSRGHHLLFSSTTVTLRDSASPNWESPSCHPQKSDPTVPSNCSSTIPMAIWSSFVRFKVRRMRVSLFAYIVLQSVIVAAEPVVPGAIPYPDHSNLMVVRDAKETNDR